MISNGKESISFRCMCLRDRNALFKAIRSVIAMNRDSVSFVQSRNEENYVNPFAYEQILLEKGEVFKTIQSRNEGEQRFQINSTYMQSL